MILNQDILAQSGSEALKLGQNLSNLDFATCLGTRSNGDHLKSIYAQKLLLFDPSPLYATVRFMIAPCRKYAFSLRPPNSH